MAIVKIEGQQIPLDDAICRENKTLIAALSPYYPAVANADIKREGKEGNLVVTVTKKAGSKGSYARVVSALDKTPETISRLLVIATTRPKSVSTSRLDDAIIQSLEEEKAITRVMQNLDQSEAESANTLPAGF